MRPLYDMDTIQIEITNHCLHRCSNCTRFVGHHRHPYFMDMETFQSAVDSMILYPKMTGIMGGEPLLHPEFRAMCEYLGSKIPPERCGLWSCFPPGFEEYRDVIVATFGNIFLNDQSRADILHAPLLVRPDEVAGIQDVLQWYLIDKCWVQNAWSAAINPRGAFFCEIAAAMAMLLERDEDAGWEVTPDWWWRTPRDYVAQMERYCILCGAAMPLYKRESVDTRDDAGPWWLGKLAELRSPKYLSGNCLLHDGAPRMDERQIATYKDPDYRDAIAARYGMFLMSNERGFQTPYLKRKWCGNQTERSDSHGR
jgi:hypothetical protein